MSTSMARTMYENDNDGQMTIDDELDVDVDSATILITQQC